MQKLLLCLAAMAVILGLGSGSLRSAEAPGGFTPWMSRPDLEKFLLQFDTNPPGGHPNYWDKGHWIDAVEGRWQDGIRQYRFKYSDTPKGSNISWYWFFDQDEKTFKERERIFAAKGFTLLDPNSYVLPDGTLQYQGVWHIATPRFAPAAAPELTPAQKAAREASLPVIGVNLIPHGTTFKDFGDFEESVVIDPSFASGIKITSAELEIRFAKGNVSVIRFPYLSMFDTKVPLDDERAMRIPYTEDQKLGEAELRRMGAVQPGDYDLAMYVNGMRASNVIRVRIDPQFKKSEAPTLELETIEPNPRQTQAELTILARGPDPMDPNLTMGPSFVSAPLVVDGVQRQCGLALSGGQSPPLRSGMVFWRILPLENYRPAIDLNRSHRVSFNYETYVAEPFSFDPDEDELNREWDAATTRVKLPGGN